MQTNSKGLTFSLALTALTMASPAAAQSGLTVGPYVGISVGGSVIETGSIGLATTEETSHSNGSAKVSVGYWFNDVWGIEGSYVPIGRFEQTYGSQTFKGRTDSYAMSLMARLPVGSKWSLIGKLNLAYNKTRDKGSTPGVAQFDNLRGSETNLVLLGLAANYQLNKSTSVFFELDPRGTAANNVDIGYAGVGVRYSF
jgi:hypothetical protein